MAKEKEKTGKPGENEAASDVVTPDIFTADNTPLDNPPSGAVTQADADKLEKERELADKFEARTGADVLAGDDPFRVGLEDTQGATGTDGETYRAQQIAAEKKFARLNEPGRPAAPAGGAVATAEAAEANRQAVQGKAATPAEGRSRTGAFVVPSTDPKKVEEARAALAENPSHNPDVRGVPVLPQPLNRKAAEAMGIGTGANTHGYAPDANANTGGNKTAEGGNK